MSMRKTSFSRSAWGMIESFGSNTILPFNLCSAFLTPLTHGAGAFGICCAVSVQINFDVPVYACTQLSRMRRSLPGCPSGVRRCLSAKVIVAWCCSVSISVNPEQANERGPYLIAKLIVRFRPLRGIRADMNFVCIRWHSSWLRWVIGRGYVIEGKYIIQ